MGLAVTLERRVRRPPWAAERAPRREAAPAEAQVGRRAWKATAVPGALLSLPEPPRLVWGARRLGRPRALALPAG